MTVTVLDVISVIYRHGDGRIGIKITICRQQAFVLVNAGTCLVIAETQMGGYQDVNIII